MALNQDLTSSYWIDVTGIKRTGSGTPGAEVKDTPIIIMTARDSVIDRVWPGPPGPMIYR